MQKQHYWHETKRVPGPFGYKISAGDLPPIETLRWNAKRKSIVVTSVNGGLLTRKEACERYKLSDDEFSAWQRAYEQGGVEGLKVRNIKACRS